jgi:hypothetical protein
MRGGWHTACLMWLPCVWLQYWMNRKFVVKDMWNQVGGGGGGVSE